MADAPTVGLALIARNEEKTLPTLLESVRGAFDQVVLVDTGSTDRTREIFSEWAAGEVESGRLDKRTMLCAGYKWDDDFGAARRFAHSKLVTDFECWADADDEIVGAGQLRQLAAAAPPELHGFVFTYDYGRDPAGRCVCQLKRERLVRAGAGVWEGRVHEAQKIDGPLQEIPPEVVVWRHHKPLEDFKPGRNLRILQRWLKDEPENPRTLMYVGTELVAQGKHKRAAGYFRRYLQLEPAWDEERAQVHRKYALSLMALGRVEDAISTTFDAIRLMPAWPDSYLSLSEAHYRLGEHAKALEWAREAQRRGAPNTMLIINPFDYIVEPKILAAGALAGLGQLEQAVREASEAWEIAPGHPKLAPALGEWRKQLKREMTAKLFLDAAECLVAHDEQLKALRTLEQVPHFAIDHPQIVAARSQLRERILPLFSPDGYADHYETGGSKPEDAVEDYLAVGDALPRCEALLVGLMEQAGIEPEQVAA